MADGVGRNDRLATIEAALRLEGFESCDDDALEDGIEKVALFADGGLFTHTARQLRSGRWTSKLGADCDIEHELEALVSHRSPSALYRYGEIVAFMRRPRHTNREEA